MIQNTYIIKLEKIFFGFFSALLRKISGKKVVLNVIFHWCFIEKKPTWIYVSNVVLPYICGVGVGRVIEDSVHPAVYLAQAQRLVLLNTFNSFVVSEKNEKEWLDANFFLQTKIHVKSRRARNFASLSKITFFVS